MEPPRQVVHLAKEAEQPFALSKEGSMEEKRPFPWKTFCQGYPRSVTFVLLRDCLTPGGEGRGGICIFHSGFPENWSV